MIINLSITKGRLHDRISIYKKRKQDVSARTCHFLGVSVQFISFMENGRKDIPQKHLDKLSKHFNVSKTFLRSPIDITNIDKLRSLCLEDLAKHNVRHFMYPNGYRLNTIYQTSDYSEFDNKDEAIEHEKQWLLSIAKINNK